MGDEGDDVVFGGCEAVPAVGGASPFAAHPLGVGDRLLPGEAGSFGPGRLEAVAERRVGVVEELVEAAADGGELEPVADLVAGVGGGGGEAQGAVHGIGGVDGGECLDGADDCRVMPSGPGEVGASWARRWAPASSPSAAGGSLRGIPDGRVVVIDIAHC